MEDFDFVTRIVLVVDDEPVNRELLAGMLEDGYSVLQAGDGNEAMSLIEQYGEDISLVMLDLYMPGLNGYEVLQKLNEKGFLKRFPVIVLTSDLDAEVKSLELGAADFISKPYSSVEIVRARVRRIIKMHEDAVALRSMGKDSLTDLYSTGYFFRRVGRIEKFASNRAMDAIVINVDKYHQINSLYGRACGDAVLKDIADALRLELESCFGVACREHADNFYAYVEHQDDAAAFLNRIASSVRKREGIKTLRLRMGVYPEVDHTLPIEERFVRAEHACQSICGNYARKFAVYDADMFRKEAFAHKLVDEFEEALIQGQFRVWYQPQHDIRGDTPVRSGAEALVRWIHPDFGMIRPDAFIPLFEENGLIAKLDHFVWRTVALQIRKWKDDFGEILPVSVNVSRINTLDPGLENDLQGIVRDCGIENNDLVLEVTESAYADSMGQLVETVNDLRRVGFHVEMDDFGSGYSSLSMLTTLPIDALKLDRTLVRGIVEHKKDLYVLNLVLDIAKSLDLPVVAEGVETKAQLDLLKKAGCDRVQGYYFSRPVPADEFVKFLSSR